MIQILQLVFTVVLILAATGSVILLARLWRIVKRLENRASERLEETHPAKP